MNLNQVTLPAKNLQKSVVFYKALGFIQIVADKGYARFECPEGESTFSLEEVTESNTSSGVVIYFEVDNLESTYSELESQGVKFCTSPIDELWLWKEVRLLDPSGNKICLYSAGANRKNPPWRINV